MRKEDSLDISAFKNPSGTNYRQAEEIDPQIIKNLVTSVGGQLISFKQNWRHGQAIIKLDGQKRFLKVASTLGIGERTKNETIWNDYLNDQLEKKPSSFTVPRIFQSGVWQNHFFYLSEFVDGLPLAEKGPVREDLADWLERIVETQQYIQHLPPHAFSRDQGIANADRWANYKKKIADWGEVAKPFAVEGIIGSALHLERVYTPGVTHGDFVPWHLFPNRRNLVLIDGEHASSFQPRYYDVAYFYHRLWTTGQRPDLAKQYLAIFCGGLTKADQSQFDEEFCPVLASRILGGFWDVKTDGQADVSFHLQLKDAFLSNTLR